MGLLNRFIYIFPRVFNRIMFYFYKLFPINNNLIIMESNSDFSDNTQALYNYMRKNGYLKKYKVIWLSDNPKKLMETENIKAIYKRKDRINFSLDYYMAVCKYFIYSHNNEFSGKGFSPKKNQIVFNLWHGVPYKKNDGVYTSIPHNFLSTGEYCTKYLAKFLSTSENLAVELGYPRIDYFFDNSIKISLKIEQKYNFSKYKKVILWMPTFRKSKRKSVSEIENVSSTGLPIFTEEESLKEFDEFLNKNNVLFVLKVHPAQAELPIFQLKFKNIRILKNEDLQEMGIQPYQFIPLTDALVSDYSSVAIDYMVLDKPIVYTLDDYEDYAKSRGFVVDNVLDYMPGYHAYNAEDMEKAISEIADGKDVYKEQRNKILPVMHKYSDGDASKRVLDYLNIKK